MCVSGGMGVLADYWRAEEVDWAMTDARIYEMGLSQAEKNL